jgi:hypothetical protein
MPMIAFVLMVVVPDQPLPFEYIDQGILESMGRTRCSWNVIRFHFHQSSLLVHVFCVEDQLRLLHMAVDTIARFSVTKGIVNSLSDGTCCNLIGCHRQGTVKSADCACGGW